MVSPTACCADRTCVAGGESHFPLADNPSKSERDFAPTDDFCDLNEGLAVKAKKGDAILW